MSLSPDVKIQQAYIDMYELVSNYIWSYETVEKLAKLEVESFKLFFDWNELARLFNSFRQDIYQVMLEDEELKETVDAFEKIINERGEQFVDIYCVEFATPEADDSEEVVAADNYREE